MKRVIGKLNTRTSDGRIIRGLTCLDDVIPVHTRVPDEHRDLPLIVGTARTWIDGEDIVADIDFRYTGYESQDGPEVYYQDLIPHMEVLGVEFSQDGDDTVLEGGVLKSIFLDDHPDAFGDLGGYLD